MSLDTEYQQYIHLSRYARWRDDLGRRETWEETVDRYFAFFDEHLADYPEAGVRLYTSHRKELREAVLNLDIMPSMRCLMTAGPALKRDNVAGYNCSYVAVDNQRVFDEIMYVLLCGTGVGFSVEDKYVKKLPQVAEEFHETDTTIVVADSKIGWASAFRELVSLLYNGKIPKWDTSKVRPSGSRLKTFGGRASGPEPLEDLFRFTVEVFRGAAGRKLNTLECHDIVCKVADIVVVGGVRRSALISLSDVSDDRIRAAKQGQFWVTEPQRQLANNSACYTKKPDMNLYMQEWKSLYDSKSGERGIYNRAAAKLVAERNGRRDPEHDFGTNPCSEIILRSKQFCNLSEVVVRNNDTVESIRAKVRLATILGTMQSSLTNLRYLSKTWRDNTEEERLLGVSLTGILDNKTFSKARPALGVHLADLRAEAVSTNAKWAKKLEIPQSAAVTCVKPSGTVSQLVDSASGIHPRHAEHYIRRVRGDAKDPLVSFMIDKGFPHEDCVTKPGQVKIFSFPMQAPKASVMRNDMSAIEQLELWKIYAEHWCEHKPSITVYVRDEEWFAVGAWVYENFEICSGISFLPHTDHVYLQAPYEDVTKLEYQSLCKAMPKATDWTLLGDYENTDHTTGSQELACTGNACEL